MVTTCSWCKVPSSTFNPSLDLGMIDRAKAADPEAAEFEWGGGFRADISSFLDDATIEASVNHSRPLELPPQPGLFYEVFRRCQRRRHDHYTLAVAHEDRATGQFVIDVVRGVAPPFDPEAATEQFAKLAKDFASLGGRRRLRGGVGRSAWGRCGVRYVKSELPKSRDLS